MEISGLLMLVLMGSVGVEGGVGPSSNSTFCTESKECLEYELVCKTDEYEVRHYSPTRWVSTDAEAYFMGVGAAMAFRRLFQYITGANNHGVCVCVVLCVSVCQSIVPCASLRQVAVCVCVCVCFPGVQMEMTAPVLVRIPEETRVWEPAIYTLSFLLPAAFQDKTPTPTNDKLYFTDMPAMDVYVRSYGGWMLSVTSRLHAHLLTKELARVQAVFNHTYHYGVGYDSPLKLLNRHNEVWYVAEGDAVCSDPQEPTPPHTPAAARTPEAHTSPFTPSRIPPNVTTDSPSVRRSTTPSQAPGVTPSEGLKVAGGPVANSSNPRVDGPWNNTVEASLEDAPSDNSVVAPPKPHLA
uniref:Heme-binding protein soul5, like n=1 Tax=Esox lucius TaxID=8010 RepID=A0AAY5KE42_ESOLU